MDESVRWLYQAGKEAFERKDYEESLNRFLEFVREVDGFADVWNMMGQMYYHQGEMMKAAATFEKAVAINPRYASAILNLAVTYADMGDYNKAEELQERLRNAEPGEGDQRIPDPFARGKLANMHADIADIYAGMALYGPAIDEYQRALDLRPDFPDVRERMAKALFDAGKQNEAIAELNEVKEKRPDYVGARINLGMFLYSTGKEEEAEKEWKEVLEMVPENRRAKMYLRLARKKKL